VYVRFFCCPVSNSAAPVVQAVGGVSVYECPIWMLGFLCCSVSNSVASVVQTARCVCVYECPIWPV
jgi:hypothetical protein